jgi:hypothetical protein
MPMRCSVKCISKAKTSKAAPVALPTLQSGLKLQVSPTCFECVPSLTFLLPFRWPSTPNKQRTAKLPPNPRAHSKVHCDAECHLNACCAQHVTAWQGSGHCPGSSAPAAAAFVPTAATKVPEVDSSQTTAQVLLPNPVAPRSPIPLSGCRHALRWQARAADTEGKFLWCATVAFLFEFKHVDRTLFSLLNTASSLPQSATCMHVFPDLPLELRSLSLLVFHCSL